MNLTLPRSTPQYNQDNETQTRQILEQSDGQNIKKGAIQVSFLMQSPNGSRFTISVTNAGAILVTPL